MVGLEGVELKLGDGGAASERVQDATNASSEAATSRRTDNLMGLIGGNLPDARSDGLYEFINRCAVASA
jgi:hypothetical protein